MASWTGVVQPSPMSESYMVRIEYTLRKRPVVRVPDRSFMDVPQARGFRTRFQMEVCVFTSTKIGHPRRILRIPSFHGWPCGCITMKHGMPLGGGLAVATNPETQEMKKRILSIDGGGIKGVFPISFPSRDRIGTSLEIGSQLF